MCVAVPPSAAPHTRAHTSLRREVHTGATGVVSAHVISRRRRLASATELSQCDANVRWGTHENAPPLIAALPRPRARAKKHTTTLPPGAPNAPGPLSEGALLAPDPQIRWGTSSEEHLRRTIARRYHSRSLCVSCVRPCPVCP